MALRRTASRPGFLSRSLPRRPDLSGPVPSGPVLSGPLPSGPAARRPGPLRRRGPLSYLALTAAAVLVAAGAAQAEAAGPLAVRAVQPAAASCLASGTDATINAALVGTGAQAILCPGAVFLLQNPVTFTAPNQELYTQGLPTDSTRAVLRVEGASQSTAVQGNNETGVTVENIQVDGNRPNLGYLSTGGALMEMGGAGTGQTVQEVYAHDTRGWSTLHFIEGAVTDSVPQCQSGKILDNQIGPAGTPGPPGAPTGSGWADGISMACGNSLVQGNAVTDATDGGIVVFGAPGSTIEDNTITAETRQLFGGINMVDYAPMNGNYTGTLVEDNTIDAAGAYIKVGLAQGQQIWNCTTGTNYGATVSGNTLEGAYMGYGYAVNGVSGWTDTGNVDNSTHVGTQSGGGCFGSPAASAPAGFQVQAETGSTLQSQFVSAQLTNVLSVTSPNIPAAALGASPSSVNFGSVAVRASSATQIVTVTNQGSTPVAIYTAAVSGPFAGAYPCGGDLAAGASCQVPVSFTPTASGAAAGSLTLTTSASNSTLTVPLSGTGGTSGGGGNSNLALGATMTASGSTGGFPPSNANDGNTGSYWESTDSAFPQWLEANLGSAQSLGPVTLTLPPSTAWATRTQTFSVLDSSDGSNFTTIVPSAGYTFNPSTGNTVTFTLPSGTDTQYLRLNFTANTGWPAGQVSEFEIFAPSGGGTGPGTATLAASPSSLSFGSVNVGSTSGAQSVSITNSGSAAATISGVTASGPFAETNTCGGSLAAGASCTVSVTFTPTAAGAASGSVAVASSASNASLTVPLSGTGVSSSTNIALNMPTTASGYTQSYTPANAVDGNTSTYWESTDNAFPQWIQVDLGSNTAVASLVLDLPPATAWATRTETITVQGSTDGTNFTTLVASAGYTFNPATGNTAAVALPAGSSTRYLRLTFTANTGWPAGQLSELEVFP